MTKPTVSIFANKGTKRSWVSISKNGSQSDALFSLKHPQSQGLSSRLRNILPPRDHFVANNFNIFPSFIFSFPRSISTFNINYRAENHTINGTVVDFFTSQTKIPVHCLFLKNTTKSSSQAQDDHSNGC
ncbi:hypothetical protein Dimus_022277 [Dionaea muscipula]